jgi:hypothetical protein
VSSSTAQIPGRSPYAHQIPARWYSSSEFDPGGDESAQHERKMKQQKPIVKNLINLNRAAFTYKNYHLIGLVCKFARYFLFLSLVKNYFVKLNSSENQILSSVSSPSVKNSGLSILSIIFFLFSFLSFSKFHILTIASVTVILGLITYLGLCLLLLVSASERKITILEATGTGFGFGLLICITVFFGFEIFNIGLLAIYILMFFSLFSILSSRFRKLLNIKRLDFQIHDTSVLFLIICLALSASQPLLIVPSIIFLLISITNLGLRSKSTNFINYSKFASIVAVNLLTFYLLSVSNPGPSNYLFGSGAESIPRESWANSVLGWGPSENIALFGNPLRYHWLSFTAFGLITRLARLDPLSLSSSGLLGMLDAVTVGAIIWSSVFLVRRKRIDALFALFILYSVISVSEPFHLLSDSSPDATTWLVWFALFQYLLVCFENHELLFPFLILPLVASSVILSNGAYGSALAIGLVGWVVAPFLNSPTNFKSVLDSKFWTSILTLALMTATYYIFLTPSNYSTRIIQFSTQFVMSYHGLSVVTNLFVSRIIWILYLRNSPSIRMRGFFIGLLCVSPLAFLIFRNSTGSLSPQFAMPILLASSVIGSFALSDGWKTLSQFPQLKWVGSLTFIAIGISLQVLFNYFERRASSRVPSLAFTENIYIIHLAIVLLSVGIFWLGNQKPTVPKKFTITISTFFSVFLVFSIGLGVGLGYSFRSYTREFAESRNGRSITRVNERLFTLDFQESMDWLRTNSDRDSLIATNYLSGLSPQDFNTDSKYPNSKFGISAISQRRVLIEGAAWAHVGLVYSKNVEQPPWLTERISMSHRFASRPDKIAAEYMKKMGITWFVVDKSKQMPSSWSPYASIAFENSEVIILKTNF